MDKKTGFIIGGIVVVFALMIGFNVWQNAQNRTEYSDYKLSKIIELSDQKDFSSYDFTKIIPADENSGNLPENIEGDPNAPIIITEYADYQCGFCAPMNPHIVKLVQEYDGKVAVIMRTYILDYHQNGVAAASAANAAAIQGYWKEYKDLLYANQNEWAYANISQRQQLFENYFKQVSKNQGDLEKFRHDMQSEAVAQKIAFDRGIGSEIKIGGTPWFYIDGEHVESDKGTTQAQFADKLRKVIDQKLAQAK